MKRLLPFLLLFCVGLHEPRVLRVCADPEALPYEKRVASIVADELGARVEYTWWVQRRGFFRNTLNADKCDVVVAVPKAIELARTTNAKVER
jgi:mxaJ protein